MKIAIVGSGVSGLQAGLNLHKQGHAVTVFEKSNHIGGHVQTIKVPFSHDGTEQQAIVDCGDFMFDPVQIHPYLHSLMKENKVALTTVPLDFTLYNDFNKLAWSSAPYINNKFRDYNIYFSTIKSSIKHRRLIQHAKYFTELKRFMKHLSEYAKNKQLCHMPLEIFIPKFGYSSALLEDWIFPHMLCWWGATRETVLQNSVQVLADSMYKVSQAPQYTFTGGFDQVVTVLSQNIIDRIHLNTPVKRVVRKADGVIVSTEHSSDLFDALILAIPPSQALNILEDIDEEEKNILQQFKTTTTRVYLHTDTSWLPKLEPWSKVNYIHDTRGRFCTFWVGKIYPLAPKIFISWGDQLRDRPNPDKTLKIFDWLRTLPTVEYTHACYAIQNIQGKRRTWYCGAHVDALSEAGKEVPPSLWCDNALKSGINASKNLHKWSTNIQ